ncbi:unnamed protein product [Staurois parvus]|uniref:Uncharacterized protein n=1 Tax=Staurois parvus TaxID=386267 RepID=A0ABN9DDK5_9NEOB|nr:unnamed protein product [Staurois parvus]
MQFNLQPLPIRPMYINGQMGAVQGQVAVYKQPPHSLGARSTAIRCPLCPPDRCTGPPSEVPIM